MSTHTLSYFPVRARGETLRMLFAHAKIPFTDNYISFADWGKEETKAAFPAGNTGKVQLPVLQKPDGSYLAESMDIAKYIAEKAGLLGEDPAESERLWQHCESPAVIMSMPILNLGGDYMEKLPAFIEGAPKAWASLASDLKGAYYGGGSPSYADFQIFNFTECLSTLDGGATVKGLKEGGDEFRAWYKTMSSLPAVADCLADRPQYGSDAVGLPGSLIFTGTDPLSLEAVQDALKKSQ